MEYLLGDFGGAEHSEAKAVEARKAAGVCATDDRRQLNELLTRLALARIREGPTSEVAQTVAPEVKFQRELATHAVRQWRAHILEAQQYAGISGG